MINVIPAILEKDREAFETRLEALRPHFFKAQIDNMATEASRMAREYELAMQRAIKKGESAHKVLLIGVVIAPVAILGHGWQERWDAEIILIF